MAAVRSAIHLSPLFRFLEPPLLLIGEHEFELLAAAQEKWRDYRRAIEDCALREFEGGTHATLAMALAGLSETERRTDEIKAQVAERGAR